MVIIQELTLREDNKYIQINKKDFSLALEGTTRRLSENGYFPQSRRQAKRLGREGVKIETKHTTISFTCG